MADNETKKLNRKFLKFFAASQTIALVLFIILLIWLFGYLGGFGFNEPALVFNFHPLLMTIGFVILYSNAILIYRTFRFKLKRKLKWAHAAINLASIIFISFGLAAAIYYHEKVNIAHFYSLHSWLGLLAIILFVSQYIVGFVTYLYPGVSLRTRVRVMHIHRFAGMGIFILACGTIFTGLNEKAIFSLKKYSDYPAAGLLINLVAILLIAYASLVLYLVTRPDWIRIPLSELHPNGNEQIQMKK